MMLKWAKEKICGWKGMGLAMRRKMYYYIWVMDARMEAPQFDGIHTLFSSLSLCAGG